MEYANRRRKARREAFLEQMDKIIPRADWVIVTATHYPSGKRGRPPLGVETTLRMYLTQNWFNLSDEGIEDAIYDSNVMRTFLRINFLQQQVPDATTLLHFRHLLEKHELGKALFDDIRSRRDKAGLIMHGGSVVDATLISAPSSTKNQNGERDPANAFDEKRRPVVFWHESPCRRRRRKRVCPYHHRDLRQRS
ncbi:transposase [Pyramidobacter porci]|uniref:transposase n=1 Tax=Pyramidobacter porci TaxID=2605789 RepID=UPI00389A72A2